MADKPAPDPHSPDPEGKFLGLPYDFSKPTMARAKSRLWNPQDPRVFTPKSFGWGYDLNFYWLAHPRQYFKKGKS